MSRSLFSPQAIALLATLCGTALFACESEAAAQALELRAERDSRLVRGPIDARVGESVRLVALFRGRPLPAGSQLRWIRIAPYLQHERGRAAGASPGDPTYTNTVLGGPNHGRWVGLDAIEYRLEEIVASAFLRLEGSALIVRGAPRPNAERGTPARRTAGAGTIWIAARAILPNGEVVATADLRRGRVEKSSFRLSFREDDSFAGWVSAYFGVPYVFGSTPSQSRARTGIDCADVLVDARRQQTARQLPFTSVSGMHRYATALTAALRVGRDGRVRDAEGALVELRWGETIRPGDLVAIDYASPGANAILPRPWDHIGVLLGDGEEGERGALDAADLLRHMSRRGLEDEPIRAHGPIRIQIWRWQGPAARSSRSSRPR